MSDKELEQLWQGSQTVNILGDWKSGMPLSERDAITALGTMETFFRYLQCYKNHTDTDSTKRGEALEPCRPCPFECYIGSGVDIVGIELDFFIAVCGTLAQQINTLSQDVKDSSKVDRERCVIRPPTGNITQEYIPEYDIFTRLLIFMTDHPYITSIIVSLITSLTVIALLKPL